MRGVRPNSPTATTSVDRARFDHWGTLLLAFTLFLLLFLAPVWLPYELLTGWVLGRLPDSEEDVARAHTNFATAALVALLYQLGVEHEWLQP